MGCTYPWDGILEWGCVCVCVETGSGSCPVTNFVLLVLNLRWELIWPAVTSISYSIYTLLMSASKKMKGGPVIGSFK
jgi:hypothetical protein